MATKTFCTCDIYGGVPATSKVRVTVTALTESGDADEVTFNKELDLCAKAYERLMK